MTTSTERALSEEYVVVYEGGFVHNMDQSEVFDLEEAEELCRTQNRVFNSEGWHYVVVKVTVLMEGPCRRS